VRPGSRPASVCTMSRGAAPDEMELPDSSARSLRLATWVARWPDPQAFVTRGLRPAERIFPVSSGAA
jgi:hypothetical protein